MKLDDKNEYSLRMEAIKIIIKKNYPDKYKELIEREKKWPPDNIERYFTQWIKNNIRLSLDDRTSLEIYSRHYGITVDELVKLIKKINSKSEEETAMPSNKPIQQEVEMTIDVSDELKKNIDRAVIATAHNHQYHATIRTISNGLLKVLNSFSDSNIINELGDERFFEYISRKDLNFSGISLRNNLIDYYTDNNLYTVITDYSKKRGLDKIKGLKPNELFAIDILKLITSEKESNPHTKNKLLELLKEIDLYISKAVLNEKDAIDHKNKIISILSNINVEELTNFMHEYFDKIDIKELFRNEDIEYEEITNTAHQLFSNANSYSLNTSANAVLLHGKIQVSSDRGYPSKPYREQEDAVGSLIIDDNHYINIVADGVGGASRGNVASRYATEEILRWYEGLSEYELSDTNSLTNKLRAKIQEIDYRISNEIYGAYTTIVIALTNGADTIIMNSGDSTAYSYDYMTDELIELTTLDSYSRGLSYEEARYNPYNNRVTSCLGTGECEPHINIIENRGQKIILSSDGVTDLISEENFKKIFKNNISSSSVVQKAKFNPDVNSSISKKEDNISAIIVELPQKENINRRGY